MQPDGRPGIFGVVEKPDFALVIPFDGERYVLVEQFRYTVGARYWEFPMGAWEARPDVDPAELARRELAEETGLRAGSLRSLGHLYEAYGYSDQGFHVFLAEQLEQGEQALEPTEADLVVGRFTLGEVHGLVRGGKIKDAPTVAALALLRLGG